MALSNRDRIDRMFQVMAPVLDDYISQVIGQGDPEDVKQSETRLVTRSV